MKALTQKGHPANYTSRMNLHGQKYGDIRARILEMIVMY
jgi:hypothetical protein